MSKPQKSSQASAAAMIKKHLQSQGLKVKAKSDSFSMGDSVNVDIVTPDLHPDRRKEIEAYCAQFQRGHFNSMEDIYEYSNKGTNLPQTKYCHVSFTKSDECRAAIKAHIARIEGINEYEADRYEHMAWQGSWGDFWDTWKPETPKPAKNCAPNCQKTVSGATIEQHMHTKKGFEMWLVIPADRVERDEFNALRDAARDMGGWYSRKWAKTPGGFAFKDQEQAEQFQIMQFAGENMQSGPELYKSGPKLSNPGTAEKLRTMADKLQTTIDDKERPRLENTPKRQLEGGLRRQECARLKRTRDAMTALAAHHEAGTVPTELAKVTTKKAIYELTKSGHESGQSYYSPGRDTGEPFHDTPAAHALWALLKPKTVEELRAEKLRAMIEKLTFAKIPGYFPTPPDLAARMVEEADIQPGQRVLEPSAGSGAIADAARAAGGDVACFECWHSLREILEAKGHHLAGSDFLECEWRNHFDCVVMNPPFEKGQDMDHVKLAFDTLRPGGRLVSIMSPAFGFHSSAKAEAFRGWFDDLGGERHDLKAGTFKESGTGVASVLVIIDKP